MGRARAFSRGDAFLTMFQTRDPAWTAVASTGIADESAAGIYAFTDTAFEYLPESTSVTPISARYNVTNVTGSKIPLWTTLELRALDDDPGSSVTADLIGVFDRRGSHLCTVTSDDSPFLAVNLLGTLSARI